VAARKKLRAEELGRAMARRVLKQRRAYLAQRASAVAAAASAVARPASTRGVASKAMAFRPVDAVVEKTRRDLGPPAAGRVLVAEGDSWFDYPLWDILKDLEGGYGYEVESVAHMGDRVEDMA
jgi:hypothetical protein